MKISLHSIHQSNFTTSLSWKAYLNNPEELHLSKSFLEPFVLNVNSIQIRHQNEYEVLLEIKSRSKDKSSMA